MTGPKIRANRVKCSTCTMRKTNRHTQPCKICDGYSLPAKKPKVRWVKKGMIKVAEYYDD